MGRSQIIGNVNRQRAKVEYDYTKYQGRLLITKVNFKLNMDE